MNLKMNIIFFIIILVIIFIVDYLFFLKPKLKTYDKKNKSGQCFEITYLTSKFKLNKTKLYNNSILLWIAFFNAFIISLVTTVITMIPIPMFFQLLIGIVLLLGLIYSIYELFGRYLVRKGY